MNGLRNLSPTKAINKDIKFFKAEVPSIPKIPQSSTSINNITNTSLNRTSQNINEQPPPRKSLTRERPP